MKLRREFYARYLNGYTVFVHFEELKRLFRGHRRKPVACGRVVELEQMQGWKRVKQYGRGLHENTTQARYLELAKP